MLLLTKFSVQCQGCGLVLDIGSHIEVTPMKFNYLQLNIDKARGGEPVKACNCPLCSDGEMVVTKVQCEFTQEGLSLNHKHGGPNWDNISIHDKGPCSLCGTRRDI